MLIKEFRIVMPMTVEEYQVGQLYCVAEASRQTSGDTEGIEILENKPFTDNPLLEGDYSSGQYTSKVYHFASKVPAFIRYVMSSKSLAVQEEAWNAYPYCRTILTNTFLGNHFSITVESIHLDDQGETENAHRLSPEQLKNREVVYIDIANDPIDPKDDLDGVSPKLFVSEKAKRGPLSENWRETTTPVMTCYKLVKVEFHWFGLQTRVESWIQQAEQKLFLGFHRKVFCSMDKWYGLTLADIRQIEDDVKRELEELKKKRKDSV